MRTNEALIERLQAAKMKFAPDNLIRRAIEDAVAALASAPPAAEPTADKAKFDAAFDKVDHYLRANLDDTDYAEYADALQLIYEAPPAPQPAEPARVPVTAEWVMRMAKLEDGCAVELGAEPTQPATRTMMSIPQDAATQAQVAAVLLEQGTPAQQEAALRHLAGVPQPATQAEADIKPPYWGAVHTERGGRVELSPQQYRQVLDGAFLRGVAAARAQPSQGADKATYRAAWAEFCKVKSWTDSEFAAIAARAHGEKGPG